MRGRRLAPVVSLVALLGGSPVPAQLPTTDIYWVQFKDYGTHGATIDTVINLTRRAGYDNQPLMSHGGVYFTSRRDSVQNDIYFCSLADSTWLEERRVTETAESEYSPTDRPGFESFTVVRVERDSTQQLQELSHWGYPSEWPLQGIAGTDHIGYHAWIDGHRLLLFTIDETNDLNLVDLKEHSMHRLARNVGRSFSLSPLSPDPQAQDADIAFIQLAGDSAWLSQVKPKTGKATPTILLPTGVQDVAWVTMRHSAFPICGSGSQLLRMFEDQDRDPWWETWIDLEPHGIRGITRLTGLRTAPGGRIGILVVADDSVLEAK